MNESAFRSGTSGGPNLSAADPDIGEVTLSEMNPEEIRKELKRLYTQLEILKNKTLRLDNPHISKRRGGRKTHRRFSLQVCIKFLMVIYLPLTVDMFSFVSCRKKGAKIKHCMRRIERTHTTMRR